MVCVKFCRLVNDEKRYMYSLRDAAIAVGMSKPAIFKAIKSGKISASKDHNGHWYIQPAELHRVYPPVNLANDTINKVLTNASEDLPKTQFLKLEREQLLDTINDLRRRLDKSEEERRSTQERLALLLEHKPSLTESKPEKKGQNTLWKKIFRS